MGGESGANLGRIWGESGANLGRIWGESGANLGRNVLCGLCGLTGANLG
jgi:hypothetical protein